MEHLLQLHEHRRRGGASHFQAPQMIQIGQHIQQRRIEAWIQQAQVVVLEQWHEPVIGNRLEKDPWNKEKIRSTTTPYESSCDAVSRCP